MLMKGFYSMKLRSKRQTTSSTSVPEPEPEPEPEQQPEPEADAIEVSPPVTSSAGLIAQHLFGKANRLTS